MADNAVKRERAVILLICGVIILGLGFGTLFSYTSSSTGPLNLGPPDYLTPLVLLVAGALLLIAGWKSKRGITQSPPPLRAKTR